MLAEEIVKIDLVTNVPPNAIDEITWSEYYGYTCQGCPSFEFPAELSSTISAMIIDTSGCSAEDSMRLTVIVPRIRFIPNVISPNDDGFNDFFTIYKNIEAAFFKIFRWRPKTKVKNQVIFFYGSQ